MKVRLLPALALGAALATAGCQNPDGSTDWGSTLALGAGVGLAAGLVALASADGGHHRAGRQPSYPGRGSYGGGGRGGRPYAQGYGRDWR